MAASVATLTEGMEFDVDVLTWIEEAWRDGRPVVILSPMYAEYETTPADAAIEDALLDACVDGALPVFDASAPRRWNPKYLRQRFNMAIRGIDSPQKLYWAIRRRVRIVRDDEGLTYEDVI